MLAAPQARVPEAEAEPSAVSRQALQHADSGQAGEPPEGETVAPQADWRVVSPHLPDSIQPLVPAKQAEQSPAAHYWPVAIVSAAESVRNWPPHRSTLS